ncbi:hypothetical protein ACJIZ3_004777 [Penstemon smallii]|uniref:Uncharacterized protein n=1 Tax=Penstemon smallii TaxID=265156 RepID=A0ABD3S3A5_9LAMI
MKICLKRFDPYDSAQLVHKALFLFLNLFFLGQWLLKSKLFCCHFSFFSLCCKAIPIEEELCSSSDSSHVSSRHQNSHLNHSLENLFSVFLVNSIKYFQQAFSNHEKIHETRSAPGKIQPHNGST